MLVACRVCRRLAHPDLNGPPARTGRHCVRFVCCVLFHKLLFFSVWFINNPLSARVCVCARETQTVKKSLGKFRPTLTIQRGGRQVGLGFPKSRPPVWPGSVSSRAYRHHHRPGEGADRRHLPLELNLKAIYRKVQFSATGHIRSRWR